jgi:hypothetical protein
MKHQLTTEIDIRATPQQVWDVLVDLERWSEWNPFVTSSEGVAEVGTRLVNRMETPGMRAVSIKPTVTEVDPGACFEWLGHLGVRGLFDGRQIPRSPGCPTASGAPASMRPPPSWSAPSNAVRLRRERIRGASSRQSSPRCGSVPWCSGPRSTSASSTTPSVPRSA